MMLLEPIAPVRRIADPDAAGALFAGLADEAVEVATFAYLDRDQRLLAMRHVRGGSTCRIELPFRAIAGDVLALDPIAMLMAHNHPSGDPTPSPADHRATRTLARMLDPLGVRLVDHLVITSRGTTSFRVLGLL